MSRPTPSEPGVGALVQACRELYAAIDRIDHVAATTVGVSRNDLRALNVLERGPVRAGDMAKALSLTTGAVTTLIGRLEAKGLARRTRDPDDGRVVLIAPTEAMFEQLAPLYRGVATNLAVVAGRYTAEELDAAVEHITAVTQAYVNATK